jgi:hypothetical protein
MMDQQQYENRCADSIDQSRALTLALSVSTFLYLLSIHKNMCLAWWSQQQYENRCADSIDQGRALTLALSCKQQFMSLEATTRRCFWHGGFSSSMKTDVPIA